MCSSSAVEPTKEKLQLGQNQAKIYLFKKKKVQKEDLAEKIFRRAHQERVISVQLITGGANQGWEELEKLRLSQNQAKNYLSKKKVEKQDLVEKIFRRAHQERVISRGVGRELISG